MGQEDNTWDIQDDIDRVRKGLLTPEGPRPADVMKVLGDQRRGVPLGQSTSKTPEKKVGSAWKADPRLKTRMVGGKKAGFARDGE